MTTRVYTQTSTSELTDSDQPSQLLTGEDSKLHSLSISEPESNTTGELGQDITSTLYSTRKNIFFLNEQKVGMLLQKKEQIQEEGVRARARARANEEIYIPYNRLFRRALYLCD